MSFEQALKNEVERIRDSLSETNATSLDFEISVSGRIHDGDIEIEFSIGETYSKGGKVTGGILENVLKEYKRRYGWSEVNQALCLPRVKAVTVDEEIPF